MQPLRAIVLTTLLITAFASVGCVHRANWNDPRASDGPLRDADGYARSLALDSPSLSTLTLWQNTSRSAPTPWYHSRLDHGPSVVSGVQYPTVETSRTYTFDRQSVSNGRVRDSYYQTTIRDTQRQTIR